MARQKTSRETLPDLPVVGCLSALREALANGHAVLTAEPGSGKTTLVPLLLCDEPWLDGKKILMLEPRRPAARMAARRMAALLGESVGDQVGYQVRFERRVGADTRIEVLTEGLLLRRLQSDPELSGVGLVIFDEFHERNLQGDLSLAMCLDVSGGLRDDLKLLAMSASLDAAPLAELMGATLVSAQGRSHPVEIHHAQRDSEARQCVDACLRGLEGALQTTDGDVLVFLPGRAEIGRFCEQAAARWVEGLDVQPLYGDMSSAAQDKVLGGRGPRRRVIVSTDIAETSLTIDGITAVVDSGLARKPAFDPNTGLTRLQTGWISKASALQRAGRAGRLGPGHCFRVWTAAREARLDDWSAPEVREADLAPLVLELANWGVGSALELRWLDVPPAAHWDQAVDLLRRLAALDTQGRITAIGREMARYPVHPRLAHLLAAEDDEASRHLAADIAAMLSERDPLRGAGGPAAGVDVEYRLEALSASRAGSTLPAGADRTLLRRIAQTAQQLRRLGDVAASAGSEAADCGTLLALAYPDRVALCTSGDGRRYLMRNGRAALLPEGDPLSGSRFLVVASVDAGRRDGRVWLAARLSDEAFDRTFADAISVGREVRWDATLGDVVARRVRRLDALLLEDEAVPLQADDPVADILLAQIRETGLAHWFDDPQDLRARVERMRRLLPDEGWPDFSDAGLLADLDDWLVAWLKPGQGIRQLRTLDLREVLLSRLGWERQRKLDAWLPTHVTTPAATRRRIDYATDTEPVLAVPLQEMLGLGDAPTLADGRITLLLHLLSPAGRPLAVTRDLGGFWRGAYADVKKEMRGRYPKHYWPDDPQTAKATRFTKRRM